MCILEISSSKWDEGTLNLSLTDFSTFSSSIILAKLQNKQSYFIHFNKLPSKIFHSKKTNHKLRSIPTHTGIINAFLFCGHFQNHPWKAEYLRPTFIFICKWTLWQFLFVEFMTLNLWMSLCLIVLIINRKIENNFYFSGFFLQKSIKNSRTFFEDYRNLWESIFKSNNIFKIEAERKNQFLKW